MTAKKDTAPSRKAEAAFRARVEELGGTVLEPSWLGTRTPHKVRCAFGHEVTPRPQYLAAGGGLCDVCARTESGRARTGVSPSRSRRSHDAEAAFRARVEELGGTVLGDWDTNKTPTRVRCSEGHVSAPTPNHVQQGHGICLTCTWASQDVLYVVSNPADQVVKFGITSGDPGPRLQAHAADGFTDVVSVRRGLPKGVAHRVEQDAIRRLRAQGIQPVRGREYFDLVYAMLILETLDSMMR